MPSVAQDLPRYVPLATASRASVRDAEEQEREAEEKAIPKAISSSSSDDAVMESTPFLVDNFRQFKELVADILHIPLEEVKDADTHLTLLYYLQNHPVS